MEELKSRPIPESTLDKRVQNLIGLICNVRAMEEALLEMKFDAKKNPLGNILFIFVVLWRALIFVGKLSSAQIKAGYAALKDIEAFIKTNNFNAAFVEANNTYYTRSKFTKILSKGNIGRLKCSSTWIRSPGTTVD